MNAFTSADERRLATLERRGVTKDERKRAKQLVQLIETTTAPEVTSEPPPVDERMAALTELYAWVQDWTDSARAVITRRDQLIRLGIGKRRARSGAPVVDPTPVPSEVVAVSQIATPIAALPPKSNGMSNGALALLANGSAHA